MSASRNSSSVAARARAEIDDDPVGRQRAQLLGDRAHMRGSGFATHGGSKTPPTSRTPGTCVGDREIGQLDGPFGASASDKLRDGRGTPAKMCRFGAPNAPSTSTTRLPSVARKIPTFAATRLLPTPPLPPPMATTRGVIRPAGIAQGGARGWDLRLDGTILCNPPRAETARRDG